jgi:hypothetical protein
MSITNITCDYSDCGDYSDYSDIFSDEFTDDLTSDSDDSNEYIESDIIKNKIIKLIDIVILEIDMTMKKIKEKKHVLNDLKKIKVNINNINDLINNNNIDTTNDTFKNIKVLEEVINKEINNDELIEVGISVYKKNFLNNFKNSDIRIDITNKNFYEFILKKIKDEDLIDRFENRIFVLFID